MELGRSSDVVKGRRLNKRDADARQGRAERVYDVLQTLAVSHEKFLVIGLVARVIHAEHNGHDGRLVSDNVAREALVNGAALSARHSVAAPAGMNERHPESWKARNNVGFNESGVKALVGNAVAVENHTVAVLKIEGGLAAEEWNGQERDRRDRSRHRAKKPKSFP